MVAMKIFLAIFSTLVTYSTFSSAQNVTTPSVPSVPSVPSSAPVNNPPPTDAKINTADVATAIFSGKVVGKISFQGYTAASNKTVTYIKVEIESGLNNQTSVYPYHIHTTPLSPDGNCTSARGHLDPKNIGDPFICPSASPGSCQEGDLSGKYGKLQGSITGKAQSSYTDAFLSWTVPETTILGRSVVIHLFNGTRYACANITSGTSPTSAAIPVNSNENINIISTDNSTDTSNNSTSNGSIGKGTVLSTNGTESSSTKSAANDLKPISWATLSFLLVSIMATGFTMTSELSF
ncbi:hypothetical protein G9A89_009165 [Geosiphon pyriformis]|nr:hypothetical protein G9A89_009165 [Geosiphon pyriformis]